MKMHTVQAIQNVGAVVIKTKFKLRWTFLHLILKSIQNRSIFTTNLRHCGATAHTPLRESINSLSLLQVFIDILRLSTQKFQMTSHFHSCNITAISKRRKHMPQQHSNLSTAEPNDNGSVFLVPGLSEHAAASVIRAPLTRFTLAPGNLTWIEGQLFRDAIKRICL